MFWVASGEIGGGVAAYLLLMLDCFFARGACASSFACFRFAARLEA